MMDDEDALPVTTVDQLSAGHLPDIDKGAFLKEPLQHAYICILHGDGGVIALTQYLLFFYYNSV